MMKMFTVAVFCCCLFIVCADENEAAKNKSTTAAPTAAPVTNGTTTTELTTAQTTAEPTKTTSSDPTTVPTPALVKLPPHPPVMSLDVVHQKSGNYCVLFQAGIRLGFNYTQGNKSHYNQSYADVHKSDTNETVWLNVTGSCVNKTDSIVIHSDDNKFALTLTFTKDNKSDVYVSEIVVNYTTTDKMLPGHLNKSDVGTFQVNVKGKMFQTISGQGYLCGSDDTIAVTSNATSAGPLYQILTHSLRVDAFRNSSARTFFDDYNQCTQDNKVSNIVPIAVGAALGALVLIVLIAYLVGRKRNQRGYESV